MKIVYTNADQFTNTKKCELIELIEREEREEPHIVAINEKWSCYSDAYTEESWQHKQFLYNM